MTAIKRGLGKGLNALFGEFEDLDGNFLKEKVSGEEKPQVFTNEISIDKLQANPDQPRKNFAQQPLDELVASIKIHGIIQPLVVCKKGDGYVIIAGERRYRASKLAGLKTVPCVVKNFTEREMKEVSLIENLQREDLNAIETARAIKAYMDEYTSTQEETAQKLGISRPNLTNSLRLLTLTPEVIDMVEKGLLTAGHARTLLGCNDNKAQISLAKRVISDKMSVRDLESSLKVKAHKFEKLNANTPLSIEFQDLIKEMQRIFMTKVSVIGNNVKGKICVDYFSKDDLERIYSLLKTLTNKVLTLEDLKNFNKK
ncbi:MAG: ParB/RepB/Spo0J family partition protein [Clostridia bacterium]